MKHKIGILGAGTWGMALARMLTVSGNDVTVWSALEQEIDNLSTTRVHPNLPGMTIPAEMKFTKSVEEVCTDKEILLFAVPSVFVRPGPLCRTVRSLWTLPRALKRIPCSP